MPSPTAATMARSSSASVERTPGTVSAFKAAIARAGRGPFTVIYYEACLNEFDARQMEKYLKSGPGKRYLKKRLKRFLSLTGFSLIELVVTIGIFSILLAVWSVANS